MGSNTCRFVTLAIMTMCILLEGHWNIGANKTLVLPLYSRYPIPYVINQLRCMHPLVANMQRPPVQLIAPSYNIILDAITDEMAFLML